MPSRFMDLMLTPDVQAAQARHYGRSQSRPGTAPPDTLGEDEKAFIAEMDSFYMGSVSQDGWPYVQHRGGAKGFLKVLGPSVLGFADLKGNRQLLTTGNLTHDGRVCLFLMSYPLQARLKILGRAEILSGKEYPELAKVLIPRARRGPPSGSSASRWKPSTGTVPSTSPAASQRPKSATSSAPCSSESRSWRPGWQGSRSQTGRPRGPNHIPTGSPSQHRLTPCHSHSDGQAAARSPPRPCGRLHEPARVGRGLPARGAPGSLQGDHPMRRWIAILLLCLASVYWVPPVWTSARRASAMTAHPSATSSAPMAVPRCQCRRRRRLPRQIPCRARASRSSGS